MADENFLYMPHRLKGAYGVSPGFFAGAIVKLTAEDLRVEWYLHTGGSTADDSIETFALLGRT